MSTYKIEEFIDLEQAANDVAIQNVGGMIDNEEFLRQASLVFYYTSLAAKAERQVSGFKLRLELAEAEVETTVRNEVRDAGEKITEKGVSTLVRADKGVTSLDVAIIKSQEVLKVLVGICDALRQKKDMLVMRGHMTRDEIKARLSVDGDVQPDLRARATAVREKLASAA